MRCTYEAVNLQIRKMVKNNIMAQTLSYKTLVCIKGSGSFEEDHFYYCFADEGYDFWIHAPWLEETLGVTQIKVSGCSRDNFRIRDQHKRITLLPR